MTWQLTFARHVQRNLRRLPADARRRLDDAFAAMGQDPLSGDVAALKGYPMSYRRRVGPYRILFDVDPAKRSVQVQAIERRTSTTYRRRR